MRIERKRFFCFVSTQFYPECSLRHSNKASPASLSSHNLFLEQWGRLLSHNWVRYLLRPNSCDCCSKSDSGWDGTWGEHVKKGGNLLTGRQIRNLQWFSPLAIQCNPLGELLHKATGAWAPPSEIWILLVWGEALASVSFKSSPGDCNVQPHLLIAVLGN